MRFIKHSSFSFRAMPLVVALLVIPVAAGFRFGGPGFGLLFGTIAVGALLGVAVVSGMDAPIEIARAADNRFRVLLVLGDQPITEPLAAGTVAVIAEHGAEGAPASGLDPRQAAEVLVLAPAIAPSMARWANDVTEARIEAQERLAVSLGVLATAGIDARGQVGDPNQKLALEDALRMFAASEVVFAPGVEESLVENVERRLEVPVRALGSVAAPEARVAR